MAKDGLTIFPAQCNDRAELYPYISKINDLKSRFVNKPCRNPVDRGAVEQMLSCGTLNKRLPDKSAEARQVKGLYINFVLSEADDYAVLVTRAKKCVFFVKEQGDEHRQRLSADIIANGLENKFDVEPMPEG